VFTSHTGAGSYASDVPSGSHTVQRAVLLCKTGDNRYVPFSAVDLVCGVQISSSAKYHFGLYWTISFGVPPTKPDTSDNATEV